MVRVGYALQQRKLHHTLTDLTRIDTIKVETDVSIDNEDIIGMDTDAVCVPQVCEAEITQLQGFPLYTP